MKKVILMAMVIGATLSVFATGNGDIGSVGEISLPFNTNSINEIFQNYEMTCDDANQDQIFYMSLDGRGNSIHIKYSETGTQNQPNSRIARSYSSEIKNQRKLVRESECEDPGCFFISTKYYVESEFTKKSISIKHFVGSNFQDSIKIDFNDSTLTSGTLTKEAWWPNKNFVSKCSFTAL